MKKIFVLGDSISIQYGVFLKEYLKGIFHYERKEGLADALSDLDKVKGANGGDSNQVLSYLKEKQRDIASDYLLLNCGLHDIRVSPGHKTQRVGIRDYEDNLRKIIAIAKLVSSHPVWLSSTPCIDDIHNQPGRPFYRFSADLERYNRAAERIMHEAEIPTIDLYAFTCRLGREEIYSDHIHFTQDVQRLQASHIAGWLTCALLREKNSHGVAVSTQTEHLLS